MSKKVLFPKILTENEILAFPVSSEAIGIMFEDNIGIQLHWEGSGTGTFSVQCSLDFDPRFPDNATWDALTFNPELAQPSGTDGGYLINLNQIPYPYVRLNWEPTAEPTFSSLVVQDITYTAVQYGGVNIGVEYIVAGLNTPLSVVVSHPDEALITVNLETDGAGASVSTADDVLAALLAESDVTDIVTPAVTGTGSNVQIAAAEDFLTGGTSEEGAFTALICCKQV